MPNFPQYRTLLHLLGLKFLKGLDAGDGDGFITGD
jgi:hypothetical protein